MPSEPRSAVAKVPLLVWWVIWAAILQGLVLIYLFFGRGPVAPAADGQDLLGLIGLGPLFASIVIRWVVLPRFSDPGRILPFYIIGLALAEGCGVLGIFLGGPYRDGLFLLGALGVIQFVPIFVRQLTQPKEQGFNSNN